MSSLLGRLFGRTPPAPPAPDGPPKAAQPQGSPVPVKPPLALEAFRLTTAQGLHVSRGEPDSGGAAWLVAAPNLDQAHAIAALVPPALPFACVLIAPDARDFAIHGGAGAAIAIAGRLLQTDTSGIARIKYPLGGTGFLTAGEPPQSGLRFDGPGTSMQAAFTLAPLPLTDLPAAAQGLAAEWASAAADGLSAATLIARLAAGTLRPELAGSLAALLPPEELDELGRRLLRGGADLARLQKVFPGDVALLKTLPALIAWHAGGRPPPADNIVHSPTEDEAPILPIINSVTIPPGLALNALARRHVLPRRTLCLLTTARNESPYLLDWLAYHLSVGFEHVFVYTNDNQDGSDALLEALAANGAITLVHNRRGPQSGAQQKAYAHALSVLPHVLDYRWTCILDLDEYFAFDTAMFGNVTEFIGFHEAQPVDAVGLCWAVFAALPGETWRPAPAPERFTRRVRGIDSHVKSLFRTRQFWTSHPHFPNPTLDAPFHYRTEDGRVHYHTGVHGRIAALAEHPSAKLAWINHYLLRTAEEALWKWSRGRADWVARDITEDSTWFLNFIADKFLELARPEHLVEDRRILNCAHRQGTMLEKLMALPGVAEAERAANQQFASGLAANTAAFLATPPPADAPEALLHFREMLASTR